MDLKLKGKNALITGSSRGLGFATAETLAKEGANIAINARTSKSIAPAVEKLAIYKDSKQHAYIGDVCEHETADAIIADVVGAFGGLDILITNSGGPPVGSFESFDEKTWQTSVEISFLSHARLIKAALPYLRASSAPAVLAITSYTVKHPLENLILSNSVRLATVGLIKSLAIELGGEGIRFNSILPGWTQTERVTNIMKSRAEINSSSPELEIEKQSKKIPMGRMATPQEFANVAVFLVSPAASYVNGVMLQVDGGATRGIL